MYRYVGRLPIILAYVEKYQFSIENLSEREREYYKNYNHFPNAIKP